MAKMDVTKAAKEYERAINREIDRNSFHEYFKDKPLTMKALITFALSQYMEDPAAEQPFNGMPTVDTIMANMAHGVVLRLLPQMDAARKDTIDMWASFVMSLGSHLAMVSQAYMVGTQTLEQKRDEIRRWANHFLNKPEDAQHKANVLLLMDAMEKPHGLMGLYQGPDAHGNPVEAPTTPDGTPGFNGGKQDLPEPVATVGDAPGVPPVAEVTCKCGKDCGCQEPKLSLVP